MAPGFAKSIKIKVVIRTRYTTLKELAKSQREQKRLKQLLELDISPRHSKYRLIDDLIVASALRQQ